jgi:hypothetical protein
LAEAAVADALVKSAPAWMNRSGCGSLTISGGFARAREGSSTRDAPPTLEVDLALHTFEQST